MVLPKLDREKVRFVVFRTIGNFLLLFAVYGIVMTFGPLVYLESLYAFNQARNVRYIVKAGAVQPTPGLNGPIIEVPSVTPTPDLGTPTWFGQLTGGNHVEEISPVSTEFGIVIPKIGANAPVYPNVDAGRSEEYLPILLKGVAHAAGTVFPGVAGNIFLFAHSTDNFWNVTRYNAVFYLINKLENGDEIDIYFNGVRHVYRVVNKITVDPSDVHFLTDLLPYEQLTLQTCWPPGTTLKRMLVLARPESDINRIN